MSGTTLILILTILISIVGLSSRRFISGAVLRPYRIARGSDYDTLVTSGFVHADLGHLFFNLFTFYFFGPPLEHAIGTARFIILYLCGLLVSNIGTVIKHRDEPGYASLGASGAILAVLFASIVYFPHQQIFIFPLPVPIPGPIFALGYLGFSYYSAHRAAQVQTVMATPPGAPGPMAAAPGSVPPGAPEAPPTPGGPVPAAPAPGAVPPAAPEMAAPAVPPPGAARARPPPDRINHDAHLFGALTGLVFVLLTNPERFAALLHYFG